jgi:hypothetical protein
MKYIQKQIEVDARQLTEENGENLAAWVSSVEGWRARYWATKAHDRLKLSTELLIVHHTGEREPAFVGDWVVLDDDSFTVYSDEVFNKRFEKGE